MIVIKKLLIRNDDILSRKLLKIPGIGPYRLKKILYVTGITDLCQLSDISEDKQFRLKQHIELNYGDMIGDSLRQKIKERIKFYIKIKSYRGLRHNHSLPVRGQNTRTNARTRKRQRGNVKKRIFVLQKNYQDPYKKYAKPKKRKRSYKKRTGKI